MLNLVLLLILGASLTVANSVSRNNLRSLSILQYPGIATYDKRVHAASEFDVSFGLDDGRHVEQIRLRLKPNHDIIPHGATVSYLDAKGNVERSHLIDRAEHKVFKGTAEVKAVDGSWSEVGWARLSVLRDGVRPLFEGAFTIHHDSHHVQTRSSYMRTRHSLDPYAEAAPDDYMILFRDSDIIRNSLMAQDKRDLSSGVGCRSEDLSFNAQFDTPIYSGMMKRDDTYWGALPLGAMFGKRQIDQTPGGGNSAGVNLASTIGSTAGCPSTRKVALVGVATDCGYTASFNSTDAARQSVISAMNSASSVWETAFNISLGLQNLTISPADCPGTPQAATQWNQGCGANLNLQSRLNLFSAWRGTLTDTNSHWTLMTSCPTGQEVGLAWLGQACVHGSSTTNGTDGVSETASGTNVVALTSTEWQVIAHETGHTFGAVHDCTSQTCSDGTTVASQQCCPLSVSTCDAGQAYIMNPSTAEGLSRFSQCTIGNICTAIGRNSVNTTCLSANKGVVTVNGQTCGNGIVEEGEECDCGGTAGCGANACCDPTTCRFKGYAVCDDSNEDCCTSCQFTPANTTCRASTGFCDPAETCTGTSAICPADNPSARDGQSCTSSNSTSNDLHCTSGHCTSRNVQCQTVMANYRFTTSSGALLTVNANNTYACNSQSCSISCTSPAFGAGTCYGLQQNFLDGTSCSGGGACSNGVCKGTTTSGVIRSWIDDHKTLVIGLAAGIGGFVVLLLLNCLIAACRRGSRRRKMIAAQRQAKQAPNLASQGSSPEAGWYAPAQAGGAWRPVPPPPPVHRPYQQASQGLYGAGILGAPPQYAERQQQQGQQERNGMGWEMHPLQSQVPQGSNEQWHPQQQQQQQQQQSYPAPPPPYPPPLRNGASARYA